MKADLLILDGRHLMWRTSSAFSELSAKVNGQHIGTGGLYGFLNVAQIIYNRYGGRTVVAWEGSGNFRYDLYPDYKRRPEPDEDRLEVLHDMDCQELRLKAVLRALGVEQFLGKGCEADDVIGRLASSDVAKRGHTVIYSGDSDLRQLVNDQVTCVSPGFRGKDTVYDKEAVIEKYGMLPKRLADLKALAGDSSDNIPGIHQIGEVTAKKLLAVYVDVEDVIRAAHDGDADWPIAQRFRERIIENADNIRVFKKLTTILTDGGMDTIPTKRNKKRVIQYFQAYRFRSLLAAAELNSLMSMGNG